MNELKFTATSTSVKWGANRYHACVRVDGPMARRLRIPLRHLGAWSSRRDALRAAKDYLTYSDSKETLIRTWNRHYENHEGL